MAKATLNEMEIKQLVQNEIKVCFEDLSSDVKEIKQALLGDGKYQKLGLVAKVESHEDYIKENKITNIAERGLPYVEMLETWSKGGFIQKIEEVVDFYGKGKWLIGILAGGSLAGIISSIFMVVELVKKINL